MLAPVTYTAMNRYFLSKRNFANSIAQAVAALIYIWFATIFQYLMETYGRRGTQALIAALSLHTLLGAIMFQPVKKHMVKRVLESELPKNLVEGKLFRW